MTGGNADRVWNPLAGNPWIKAGVRKGLGMAFQAKEGAGKNLEVGKVEGRSASLKSHGGTR